MTSGTAAYVLSAAEDVLFVAMTGDNSIRPLPLLPNGGTAKVSCFASFRGTSGPDGLALDSAGNLIAAHASLRSPFVLGPQGKPLVKISSSGLTLKSLTFGRGDKLGQLFMKGSAAAAFCKVHGIPKANNITINQEPPKFEFIIPIIKFHVLKLITSSKLDR